MKAKNNNQKRRAILALIYSMMILSTAIYAYNANFQEDIQGIKAQLSEKNIGTKNVDSYEERIVSAVQLKNEDEADRLFDELRKYADGMQVIYGNFTAIRLDVKKLDDASARELINKRIDEGLFELSVENSLLAKQILNQTYMLLLSEYSKIRDESIKSLSKVGKSTSKIQNTIDYGKKLNSSQFNEMINYKKQVDELIDANEKINLAAGFAEEYEKISKGKRFKNGIEEMAMNLEIGNYNEVNIRYLDLKQALAYANKSFSLIAYAKSENYTAYSQSSAELLNRSEEEYEKERYSESLSLIEQAILAGEKEKSRQALITQIRTNFINRTYDYTRKNKWSILLIMSGTLAFMIVKYPKLAKNYRKFRKEMLQKRVYLLTESIKQIQKEHYIQKKMSKKMYEFKLAKCQKAIIRAKEQAALIPDDEGEKKEMSQ